MLLNTGNYVNISHTEKLLCISLECAYLYSILYTVMITRCKFPPWGRACFCNKSIATYMLSRQIQCNSRTTKKRWATGDRNVYMTSPTNASDVYMTFLFLIAHELYVITFNYTAKHKDQLMLRNKPVEILHEHRMIHLFIKAKPNMYC